MVQIENLEVWKKGMELPKKEWLLICANLIYSCSTQLGSFYGPDWKFGGVKKRCENGCKIVDREEFSNESHIILIYSFSTYT